MLSGDNSILQKATDAKERTGVAEIVENAKLDVLAQIAENKGEDITKDQLKNILNIYFEDIATLELPNDLSNSDIKLNANQQNGGYKNISLSDIYSGKFGNIIEDTDYAPYDNPYIPNNFSHVGTENWNSGYTIRGNDGTNNAGDEFVWVPCVTDQSKVKPGDTVQIFKKITNGQYGTSSNLHPTGGTNNNVAAEDASVSAVMTSVSSYGGFYIAKYEAGILGTTDNNSLATKTVTDGSVKPKSQAGIGVWNSISRADSLVVASKMVSTTDGVKSALISGECWDTTLAWITDTADSEYAQNSNGKGNYSKSYPQNGLITGYYGTNTNNIYDMGGNASECTSENCSHESEYGGIEQLVVVRGGSFNTPVTSCPAAYRGGDYDFQRSYNGFRCVLYK